MLHARGDVSPEVLALTTTYLYAPRTWRCFHHDRRYTTDAEVCSTHVEMFLDDERQSEICAGMLHARGDVSVTLSGLQFYHSYAPRTWRCFSLGFGQRLTETVCSTHVEMFPSRSSLDHQDQSMLHARGDVSGPVFVQHECLRYAPRTWRCFSSPVLISGLRSVCSTHVEMFLQPVPSGSPSAGMLHARGDVSILRFLASNATRYAPRTWRCFSYWLYREMFH